MIKLYNTLTRQKEVFTPIEEGKVSMYVCGPTVYNYIHIGNARSTVAFDTIRRYFTFRGYDVTFISNFTDVDDKIIRVAKEVGVTAPEVAERFIQAYFTDTDALDVQRPTASPRVMDHIPEIISFIEVLIEKGFAYHSEGDVYYRTRKFEEYGKLSNISVDELEVGASQRVDQAENLKKQDPLDFALWKAAKEDEISWPSPWGQGRPGWHIECSVMATKYLGDTIDIHAGGQDLAFPHHENEIAQTEAKTGHAFAHYWMHNGFVTLDEEKMSKSIGNVVLVKDLLSEHDSQVVRFLLATTHYRKPLHYSEAFLEEAKTNLTRLQTAYQNASHRYKDAQPKSDEDEAVLEEFHAFKEAFIEKMDDDFNAANGITVLYELAKQLNIYSQQDTVSARVLTNVLDDFQEMMSIFGITLEVETELLDEEVDRLIEERNRARKNKDFQRSDEIRDQLKEQGILLEDTAQGVRWRREDYT